MTAVSVGGNAVMETDEMCAARSSQTDRARQARLYKMIGCRGGAQHAAPLQGEAALSKVNEW